MRRVQPGVPNAGDGDFVCAGPRTGRCGGAAATRWEGSVHDACTATRIVDGARPLVIFFLARGPAVATTRLLRAPASVLCSRARRRNRGCRRAGRGPAPRRGPHPAAGFRVSGRPADLHRLPRRVRPCRPVRPAHASAAQRQAEPVPERAPPPVIAGEGAGRAPRRLRTGRRRRRLAGQRCRGRRTRWLRPASRRSPPCGTSAPTTVRYRVVRLPAITARAGADRFRPGRSPRDEPCGRARIRSPHAPPDWRAYDGRGSRPHFARRGGHGPEWMSGEIRATDWASSRRRSANRWSNRLLSRSWR